MATTFEDTPEYAAARRQVRRLRGFYVHLGVYLAVNAGLLILNLLAGGGRLWSVWPLAGWGIAVVIHGASVIFGGRFLGAEWEERKLRELTERSRREGR